ncbi:alpha/beta hydrolase [Brevibacillus fluminis]|uniref:Alpha/beta hydrolase n=1 Tax=Brevibacillus fluminis TaxID=511487 RepID=A0A3M8DP43_9BACL|nr:alpha/beta hydrolase [Brevibacillus fluminis]RNB89892.1 alpha/beta hydrolase [Brevibacillus fluminis]
MTTEKKVAIDGGALFCMYEDICQNLPTVIFESGYGAPLRTWSKVCGEISGIANVFRYDRAGVGQSERGTHPMHSRKIVENLHRLLAAENIAPPYIMVGHSFGALNARLYAHLFPGEVAGLVLAEPSHEEQHEKWLPLVEEDFRKTFLAQFAIEGTYDDFLQSLDQVKAERKHFGSLPLIVLSAGRKEFHSDTSFAMWRQLHADIAALSHNSRHLIVESSGHSMQRDEPSAVAEAIRAVIRMTEDQGGSDK